MAGESRRRRLRALLAQTGAPNVDPKSVEAAFVHESGRGGVKAHERLEFLGDALLGFAVARHLYIRYPNATEGELALRKAALVSDSALAATAERLGFEPLLVAGQGLTALPAARRRTLLADSFEAFLACLYRAKGFEAMLNFLQRVHIDERERSGAPLDDPKTVLQEWTQRHYATTPTYRERFEGPDHERTFFADVEVAGEVLAEGRGASKKEAQRAAAAGALERLRTRHPDVQPRELSAPVVVRRSARARSRARNGAA